mgnify:FL=1
MLALYRNIKIRREELGMTKAELADKLGYKDEKIIDYIENGKIDILSSVLAKIIIALDIDDHQKLKWLFADGKEI